MTTWHLATWHLATLPSPRCRDYFSTWGGPPRDPFTGSLFRESAGPLYNPGLKVGGTGRFDDRMPIIGSLLGW